QETMVANVQTLELSVKPVGTPLEPPEALRQPMCLVRIPTPQKRFWTLLVSRLTLPLLDLHEPRRNGRAKPQGHAQYSVISKRYENSSNSTQTQLSTIQVS